MNISSYFKNFTSIEIAVLSVFIVYIVFPINMPVQFAEYIEHPIGLIFILIITIYLFFFTNPILGVIYILVAYEMIRRSSKIVSRVPIIEYVPSEEKRTQEMIMMNPPVHKTLEEEIVAKNAPIDVSRPIIYDQPTFKPIAENTMNASLI